MATVFLVQSDEHGRGGWGSHIKVDIASTPEADKAAAAFFSRATRYVVGEPYNVIGEVEGDLGPALEGVLYPTCEHGLSLQLCSGPSHYLTYDQERERGW